MSEMSNQNSENNGVNRAGPVGEGSSPGSCSPDRLKKDINILERVKKGQIGARKEGKAKLIEEKYRVKRKSLTTVVEELKKRVLAKAAKISRYEQRI